MKDLCTSFGLLVLRVSYGCFMLVHGIPKYHSFMAGEYDKFPDPLGLGGKQSMMAAVGAEVGCSILLILGLATRLAALPLTFTMVIAAFVIHGNDEWGTKEKAALYLAVYAALVFMGPGKFSIDHLIFGRKKETLPK